MKVEPFKAEQHEGEGQEDGGTVAAASAGAVAARAGRDEVSWRMYAAARAPATIALLLFLVSFIQTAATREAGALGPAANSNSAAEGENSNTRKENKVNFLGADMLPSR
jgi:hypothetical protein